MKKPKTTAKTFTATLEHMPGNLGWVIIRVPVDVEKVWGVRGHLKVRGEIGSANKKVSGFGFRTSLFPTGKGYHYMLINKQMQRGGGVGVGMKARFRLEPDLEERVVTEPAEWARIMKQSRAIARFYAALSYSYRQAIARSITEPKAAASRRKRAEQMAERVLQTIEAERELPPLIRQAFERYPRAWQGWQRMTPRQRRNHLLGIFYYRNPGSRQRRLEKTMEEASKRAE
ncbi:MAG: YdeI/OmpD-associated family protein [Acidobacteriota bacterium]|nr:YdeI/OmpD-associated family protein [Acidobacteriota bacterium]